MTVHEEYQNIIKQRYGSEGSLDYEKRGYYYSVLFAPHQYCIESSMLSYVRKHPGASLEEVYRYNVRITPEGLPTGITIEDIEKDLLENS